jgi:Zn-finger nucleic acid-binding protein
VYREASVERAILFCPRCDELLDPIDADVEMCPRCEGMWIGNDVLEGQWPAGPQSWWRNEVGCPACAALDMPSVMTARSSAGVIVDKCPTHGVWLDRGELSRVLRDPVVKEVARLRARLASLEPTNPQLLERRARWKATRDERARVAQVERKRLAAVRKKRVDAELERRAAREAAEQAALEEARKRDAQRSEAERERLRQAAREAEEAQARRRAAQAEQAVKDDRTMALAALRQERDAARERLAWLESRIDSLEYELANAKSSLAGARHAVDTAERALTAYERDDR